MNTLIRRFLLLVIFFGKSLSAQASHIFGGELLYTHITGYQYKVTLTFYADCGAPFSIFNSLYTTLPLLLIYNNTSPYDSFRLKAESLGLEVSPVCPAQLMNTTCNGGILPGVRKFVYSDTVNLSGPSTMWRFIFTGDMGIVSTGRSSNITNINNFGGGSIMQLEAVLNNVAGPNSSPEYSTVPTPFYCLNVESEYNQGAIDPNGDSLVFSLVPGIEANTGSSVTYLPPYSPAHPLSTDAGGFDFNTVNGQMSFTPNTMQNALVVNQVAEYRGGVLVGISRREMTFIVANNCDTDPPVVNVSDLVGGTLTGKNVINVCVGTPGLSFSLGVTNTRGDATTFTVSSLPSTSTLNILNNNTANPVGKFLWNTASIPVGTYTFYLMVKNNRCPVAFRQTRAYTINIVPGPSVAATVLSPTQCVHQAYVQYNIKDGYLPRRLTVRQGTNIIKAYNDNSGIVTDSLPMGNYTVDVSCNPTCRADTTLDIIDEGKLPLSAVAISLCKGDPEKELFIPPSGPTSVFRWFDSTDKELDGCPTPKTSETGSCRWYVIEQYKVCTSDKVPVNVDVHDLPVPKVLNKPVTLCYGDSILLQASGGVTYVWTPDEYVKQNKAGEPIVRITTPVRLTVKAIDENGCADTASVIYEDVQQCCGFSYPNAFSPNNDGRNDGFKVVTHGNMMSYMLAIYNRWGERIFLTWDPDQRWNGDCGNSPCETGTYYYYFKAKCLTGPVEEHKGDVTLVR